MHTRQIKETLLLYGAKRIVLEHTMRKEYHTRMKHFANLTTFAPGLESQRTQRRQALQPAREITERHGTPDAPSSHDTWSSKITVTAALKTRPTRAPPILPRRVYRRTVYASGRLRNTHTGARHLPRRVDFRTPARTRGPSNRLREAADDKVPTRMQDTWYDTSAFESVRA